MARTDERALWARSTSIDERGLQIGVAFHHRRTARWSPWLRLTATTTTSENRDSTSKDGENLRSRSLTAFQTGKELLIWTSSWLDTESR